MIYTIGHSNHPIERFTDLLQQHDIAAVADVRSTPYSRFNPQFGREKLQSALASVGIRYVFLGEELGARSRDPACCDGEGRVSYAKLAATELFQRGLERLKGGMGEYRIALMCAERDPLECHRTILVARELVRAGVPVMHILVDGSLEAHEDAMKRLATHLKLTNTDLFSAPEDLGEQACDLQAKQIAYVKKDRKRKRGN
jgi:uncharacterized protein (DUF488 family)